MRITKRVPGHPFAELLLWLLVVGTVCAGFALSVLWMATFLERGGPYMP